MKVFVFGTRGIPGIPGGVETHCEMIYPAMTARSSSTQITVICRSRYMCAQNICNYKGVRVKSIYAPRSTALEAIIHSFLSAVYSIVKRPDIVHVHAVGPNLLTPLLRLFGLKVIMTHHGPDYERKKWNKPQKFILKMGEWFGVMCANRVIVISNQIEANVSRMYNRKDCLLIPNGVGEPVFTACDDFLQKHNLVKGRYILAVGRFVPEKGFDYLIRAFKKSGVSNDVRLVIAGDADHQTEYSMVLKELALSEGVVLTGFIKGESLAQIYSHACLFILPSFYEGLPIALLEAMNYDLDILASDITANKEVNLPAHFYFKAGDEDDLAEHMKMKLASTVKKERYDMRPYNWDKIALQTLIAYFSLSGSKASKLQVAKFSNEIVIHARALENMAG